MSTKTKKSKGANTPSKTSNTSVVKSKTTEATVVPSSELPNLLKKLNEIETLRKYYGKLKAKKESLEAAYSKMKELTSNKDNKFEEAEAKDFPFKIIIRGENEFNREDDIFQINKKETVTSFTQILLEEVTEVLSLFEEDLIQESKKIN